MNLPIAIQTFIDSTNTADSDAFVASFTNDAYLNDWGREFHGHEGVRAGALRPGERGAGPLEFELRDGLIARLVIS